LVLFKKVNEPSFDLSNTLNTYLFNTAKYMWWRGNKEKSTNELSFDLPFTDEQELEEAILKEAKLLKAEKALLILGEKCKQILEAFYYKGLRMVEIAKTFNYASEKSAKNQKYKCLERARKEMINL
jgi:DNA-directed RNA polymerase specialized sigma24 family protein